MDHGLAEYRGIVSKGSNFFPPPVSRIVLNPTNPKQSISSGSEILLPDAVKAFPDSMEFNFAAPTAPAPPAAAAAPAPAGPAGHAGSAAATRHRAKSRRGDKKGRAGAPERGAAAATDGQRKRHLPPKQNGADGSRARPSKRVRGGHALNIAKKDPGNQDDEEHFEKGNSAEAVPAYLQALIAEVRHTDMDLSRVDGVSTKEIQSVAGTSTTQKHAADKDFRNDSSTLAPRLMNGKKYAAKQQARVTKMGLAVSNKNLRSESSKKLPGPADRKKFDAPSKNPLPRIDQSTSPTLSSTGTKSKKMENATPKKGKEGESSPLDSTPDEFGSRAKPSNLRFRDIAKDANSYVQTFVKKHVVAPVKSYESGHMFAEGQWEQLGVNTKIVRRITQGLGFKKPTRVQEAAIPKILTGRDTVIRSETGSGKTMAFLVPIVEKISSCDTKYKRAIGSLAIIMLPTRELALQVMDCARKLLQPMPWIVPGSICGGEKVKSEKARLRKGVTVLVSTPGRLLYHLQNTQAFRTDSLMYLVLDEADRLLDMGFRKQVMDIVMELKSRHAKTAPGNGHRVPWQNVLLSATQRAETEGLLGGALFEPSFIDASSDTCRNEAEYQTPKQLSQHVVMVDTPHRLVSLIGFLRSQLLACKSNQSSCRILVFMSTCASVDFHFDLFQELCSSHVDESSQSSATLALLGIFRRQLYKLHGGVDQKTRQETFRSFCKTQSGVLFCTDVAARGLDMPHVEWIIQYDVPCETVDYVHRVGRAARKGHAGSSLLMLRPCEAGYLQLLNKHGLHLAELSSQALLEGLCGSHHGRRGGSRRHQFALKYARDLQNSIERFVTLSEKLKTCAGEAFFSSTRAYNCHAKDCRAFFNTRRLHLGHVAKSFGLRDPPRKVASGTRKKNFKKSDRRNSEKGTRKERITRPTEGQQNGRPAREGTPKSFSQKHVAKIDGTKHRTQKTSFGLDSQNEFAM